MSILCLIIIRQNTIYMMSKVSSKAYDYEDIRIYTANNHVIVQSNTYMKLILNARQDYNMYRSLLYMKKEKEKEHK